MQMLGGKIVQMWANVITPFFFMSVMASSTSENSVDSRSSRSLM